MSEPDEAATPDPGDFVVLGEVADFSASPLGRCLQARPRTQAVRPTTTAPSAERVRALMLLSAGDDHGALASLLPALRERETPVLACGHGASVLAAALAGQPIPEPPAGPGRMARLRRTDEAGEPVFGDLVDGSWWLLADAAGTPIPEGATTLAIADDGGTAAFTPWPGCVATWARLDVPAHAVVELLDDPGDLAGGEAFFDGWATTLVGRWVDEVVGRVEAEAPWGRRGPPPVYDDSLFLGARQETGWSQPTRS